MQSMAEGSALKLKKNFGRQRGQKAVTFAERIIDFIY